MPLALLLSPDDQAVAAITSVLEEMSVTCERPLDGASAAQKLNSNRFDLVLVDCENLPAAKLIFDVCRNRKGGSHPVPVAVVDGRAGLPTAFRLGAELILTKPVSKDQARVTIRTAISRVRREESARSDDGASGTESTTHATASLESFAGTQHASEQHADAAADYVATEGHAFAAAATAGPAAMMSAFEPVPSAPATTPSMTMSAAVAEPEPAATSEIAPSGGSVTMSSAPHAASSLFAAAAEREETEAKAVLKPLAAAKSDSEVNAEAKTEASISSTTQSEEKPGPAEEKSQAKVEAKPGRKSHGRLVTLFVLLVACGGFYAAWTYQPGFQTIVKDQVNHLLVLIGMAPQSQHATPAQTPAKPTSQMPKPSAGVPLQAPAPEATQPAQPASSDLSAAPGTASTTLSVSPNVTSSASNTPNSATGAQGGSAPGVAPSAATASPAATTPVAKPGTIQTKPGTTRIDLSPNAVEHPASPSGAKAGSSPSATKPPPPQH